MSIYDNDPAATIGTTAVASSASIAAVNSQGPPVRTSQTMNIDLPGSVSVRVRESPERSQYQTALRAESFVTIACRDG